MLHVRNSIEAVGFTLDLTRPPFLNTVICPRLALDHSFSVLLRSIYGFRRIFGKTHCLNTTFVRIENTVMVLNPIVTIVDHPSDPPRIMNDEYITLRTNLGIREAIVSICS